MDFLNYDFFCMLVCVTLYKGMNAQKCKTVYANTNDSNYVHVIQQLNMLTISSSQIL